MARRNFGMNRQLLAVILLIVSVDAAAAKTMKCAVCEQLLSQIRSDALIEKEKLALLRAQANSTADVYKKKQTELYDVELAHRLEQVVSVLGCAHPALSGTLPTL